MRIPTPVYDAEPLIAARNVSFRYGNQTVLSDVNVAIRRGEIVTLIGPNGCGKTTLLKIMLGIVKPQSGSVHRHPALTIGYMPQKMTIDSSMPMTVEWYLGMYASPRIPNRQLRIRECAAELVIEPLLHKSVHGLSGGEWQRVMLARALLVNPDILVLDEPVQGVDVNGQAELYDLIRSIRDRHGCAVLMVSHDLHLVMAATDHVICLNHHVCCEGHPHEISQDPAFVHLFGAHVAESLAVYIHHHDHNHGPHGEVIGGVELPDRNHATCGHT